MFLGKTGKLLHLVDNGFVCKVDLRKGHEPKTIVSTFIVHCTYNYTETIANNKCSQHAELHGLNLINSVEYVGK